MEENKNRLTENQEAEVNPDTTVEAKNEATPEVKPDAAPKASAQKKAIPKSTIIVGAIGAVIAVVAIVLACVLLGGKGGQASDNENPQITNPEQQNPQPPVSTGVIYSASADGSYAEVVGYNGSLSEVVIAVEYNLLPVKSIYARAFYQNQVITSVIIPNGVTEIGDYAFSFCSRLATVTISKSVSSIGEGAFSDCGSLTTVYYEGTVEEWDNVVVGINNGSLLGANIICRGGNSDTNGGNNDNGNDNNGNNGGGLIVNAYSMNLKFVSRGDGTCYVDDVGECTDVFVSIPPQAPDGSIVTEIDSYAFRNCTNILTITIPDTVTYIKDNAFEGCTNLTRVNIGNGLEKIGSDIFKGCVNLTTIDVDEENSKYASINGNLYSKDKTTLIIYAGGKNEVSFSVPDFVTKIGYDAFFEANNLRSINIPAGVTSMGDYLFYSSSTGTGSMDYDFGYTIPSAAKSRGLYPFVNCPNLESINVDRNNENYKSVDGVLYSGNGAILIFYPKGKSDTSFTVPSGVTSINANAFSGCNALTEVTISEGVEYVCDSAFAECENLNAVSIPGSVKVVGFHAFYGCTGLERVDIGNGTLGIAPYAFGACHALESIVIPDSVKEIGGECFYYCDALSSVTLGSGLEKIGNEAFQYCYSLVSITIPDSVKEIGSRAFNWCSSLTSVTLGRGLRRIGESAFEDCNITDVHCNGNQWYFDQVDIYSGNENLRNANITYSEYIDEEW